ncbi:alpha/beta hydrolase [Gordonia lacunae]|uniref:Alpha/beta hydrolase n=1 Tax=Gordonia lacunae TaxID=417102 RepID=A0A243QE81_9ACTN|nr:alpha/beta hydrolase [Gordonia lacunae]OUC79990.1 alpha/beta hydrolase [Gordonia lacunae]
MTQRRLFFIHGAGGYVEDGPLADALSAALGATLDMPEFSGDDMSLEAWAAPIREHLAGMEADDLVVAHSFGATVLVHVLAGADQTAPEHVVLLAMPNWGPGGWDVPQYVFTDTDTDTDADAATDADADADTDADTPLPEVRGAERRASKGVALHHCVDDDVVPVEHLDLNAAVLPSATVHRHLAGGHQFDGLAGVLATDVLARERGAPTLGRNTTRDGGPRWTTTDE